MFLRHAKLIPKLKGYKARYTWEAYNKKLFKDILHRARNEARANVGGNRDTSVDVLKGNGPNWITSYILDQLCDIWASEEWKGASRITHRNWMTLVEGSVARHTGGSIPFTSHEHRMATYTELVTQRGGDPAQHQLDVDAWMQVTGVDHGRVYSIGTTAHTRTLLQPHGAGSSAFTSSTAGPSISHPG
ncbi:hypothetical protein Cni_G09883 [Canna indica]|uniref:Uncharacterized protein n=1 Tax=Canna indica TaxID=4628 RepID=A0AAQ3Q841_9LILI|nr:hypothetical protein Cni_G09883 [Canna indica]